MKTPWYSSPWYYAAFLVWCIGFLIFDLVVGADGFAVLMALLAVYYAWKLIISLRPYLRILCGFGFHHPLSHAQFLWGGYYMCDSCGQRIEDHR